MSSQSRQGAPQSHGFTLLATKASNWVGSATAFYIAIGSMIAWAVAGPLFHFSDNWQLIANTVTNVVTFIIVFLIQATQNRDAKAIHLKLDEIIRSIGSARNDMIDIEKLSDEQLKLLAERYQRIRELHGRQRRPGETVEPAA